MNGNKLRFKIASLSFIAIAVYQLWFNHLFPNARGFIGHDHSLSFATFLDSLVWLKNAGLSPMWFSPSGCGGVVRFASPIDVFYSLFQIFTPFFSAVNSVRLVVFVCAVSAFSGWYFLARKVLFVSWEVAFAGATLFLFNDFFFYRMIVGHIGFHGFMATPWLCYFLLRQHKTFNSSAWAECFAAALIAAYMMYSGASSMLMPIALSVALVCISFAAQNPEKFNWPLFLKKGFCAGVCSIALVASKVVAVQSYMENMSRTLYPLPGFSSVVNLVQSIFSSLFLTPANNIAKNSFTNSAWLQDRHEYEFGLSVVPVLVITAYIAHAISNWQNQKEHRQIPFASNIQKLLALIGLFMAFIPIALNVYTPDWNAFLKTLPIIRSASSNLRWFGSYIPLVAFWFTIALAQTPIFSRRKGFAISAIVVAVLLFKFTSNNAFYENQNFNPAQLEEGLTRIRENNFQPIITNVALPFSNTGNRLTVEESASSALAGWSNMQCYEPTFGYRLELLPLKSLHPGDVFDTSAGWFNFKNPACYVFPKENRCAAGNHFRPSQQSELRQFTRYQPFAFSMSQAQYAANSLSIASFVAIAVAMFSIAGRTVARTLKEKHSKK